MKTDIMDALLKSASDPNTAPEALASLRDAIIADNDTLVANEATISKLNGDIATLRDTNQRLFLRVSSIEEPDEEKEETLEEFNERMRSAVLGNK